jgi:hypothetical protein
VGPAQMVSLRHPLRYGVAPPSPQIWHRENRRGSRPSLRTKKNRIPVLEEANEGASAHGLILYQILTFTI